MVLQVSSLKVWRREKFQCPNCIAVTSIHKSQRGNSVTPPENKQEGMGNSLLLACQDGPRGHCKTHLRRALSRKKKTNRPCTYRARQCPHGEGKLAIVKLRLVLNCMFKLVLYSSSRRSLVLLELGMGAACLLYPNQFKIYIYSVQFDCC